jgi:hypothetical protein
MSYRLKSCRLKSCRRLAAACLFAAIFADTAGAQFKRDLPPIHCEDVESIGSASMSADGTITLQLRSLSHNPDAEAVLTYAPDDPQYDEIKTHLGGIAPGETKPVKPWC